MRAQVQPASHQVEFGAIVRAVFRGLPKLLLWSLVAGALAYGTLLTIAPRYESEAEIAIAVRGGSKLADPKRDGQSAESVAVRMDKEAINTHVRALQSRDLAEEIATELKLAELVEFNSAVGSPDVMSGILRMAGIGGPRPGETDSDRVLSAYFARLQVYPAKDSRVIGVKFTSSDPQLAANIANLLVEKYRALLASRTIEETNEALTALEPKIEALRQEAAAAESLADTFRGEANIFKGGQQATGLNEQQLGELTAELTKAKGARSEAEARIKSAREMLKTGNADAQPDVQKSPLIQNLVQQRVRVERQVSELSASLLPGHPRMQQLNADLAGLKKQITAEAAKVIESLDKEAKVAALREESINKSLAEIKARIVTASPDEVKLRQLENDAKSKRAELERLQAQYEANRASGDSRTVPVEVQIITKASPSSVPEFPKKTMFSALVMVTTFLSGLGLVITGAARARPQPQAPFARAEEASLWAGDEPAARVPNFDSPVAKAATKPISAAVASRMTARLDAGRAQAATGPVAAVAADAGAGPSSAAEQMTAIARRLNAKATGAAGYRTLVTGDTDRIEPADEALSLAQAFTAEGRSVIIVDWSTFGAGMAGRYGIKTQPGVAELLDGTAGFEDIVHSVPGTDVHVIAAGPAPGKAAGGLDADRINLVLDALDEAYQHIVVMARHAEARDLFETIEGRFDAGLLVSGEGRAEPAEPNTFLGFDVSDIEIVLVERPAVTGAPAPGVPVNRLMRVTGGTNRRTGAATPV